MQKMPESLGKTMKGHHESTYDVVTDFIATEIVRR